MKTFTSKQGTFIFAIEPIQDAEKLFEINSATETDWAKVVDKSPLFERGKYMGYTPGWKRAKFKGISTMKASHSGLSLMQSLHLSIETNYTVYKIK